MADTKITPAGISRRTHLSVAPPIYDPMGYYLRAELVWTALGKGRISMRDRRFA